VITENTTLYAKWISENATIYTVTFVSNGGSEVAQQKVEASGKVAQFTPPTRSGYTFAGWYSDAEFTTLWDLATGTVTASMTLYAKWSDEASTGVAKQTTGVARVYPNPTSGEVTVENDGAEVRLYSLSGALLKLTRSSRIDLSSYPSGIYLLKVGNKTARVVKQ
jgi:uncharacterized repeat protein (TIGR02543 family)